MWVKYHKEQVSTLTTKKRTAQNHLIEFLQFFPPGLLRTQSETTLVIEPCDTNTFTLGAKALATLSSLVRVRASLHAYLLSPYGGTQGGTRAMGRPSNG